MNNKCYFSCQGAKFFIFAETDCTFDTRCDGRCHRLNVNHSNRPYCLEINCRRSDCMKNHPFKWRLIPNHVCVSDISPFDYVREIMYTSGINKIRKMVCDNIDIQPTSSCYPFYKALEKQIELVERADFEYNDSLLQKHIVNEKLQKLKEKEIQREQRYLEQQRLGRIMVQVHFNLLNIKPKETFISEIKHNLKNKNIFKIIEEYLDKETEIVIPTFLDLPNL